MVHQPESWLCRHVIIETNKTTARIFPEVPDCETPEFWDHMEKLIVLNQKLIAVGASDAPGWLKVLQKVPPPPLAPSPHPPSDSDADGTYATYRCREQ